MRKILLSTIALLMTISVMAVGLGDGSTKANAIDFDWTNGHKPALSAGSWYRVNLSPLKEEANDPTLALYLTNLTDATVSVSLKLEASLLGKSMNQTTNYNIAAKDYQLWSKQSFDYDGRKMSLKQLMSSGLSEVYLQLTSSGEIALSAKVYETEDIVDDACSKAKDFDWAGVSVPAGEQWYRLNLSEVKTNGNKLKFVVKNNGGSEANVAFDMSLDCPASAVIEKDWTIAAGTEKEDEFGRIFLDVLNEDYVFVKLTTNQPLTLSVEEEIVVVDPDEFADFDCASAPELVFDQVMNLTAGKHVYKVKRAELIAERDFDTEFNVTNLTSETANLAVEVAFACPVKSVVTQNLVLNANESIMKLVKGDMLKAVNSEWVYIRFITDQDLMATVGMRNVSPCVNAVSFDWNTGAKLNAGESQWYEMDITTLKQNKKHLGLSFTNHADAIALVNVEVALDCNGTILPITLPVPSGLSIGQVIDYQILKRSPLNRIYVGVSTDSDIELAAWTKDAIAADQTPCLNALNPEHGVEYVHEANTTKWYKVSLDLLESTSSYSSIYLANKGNKRANVTIGMVTDCQYTTSTTITLPIPTGFDFGALAPNVLGRLLKQVARFESAYNKVDAKDVYLEIHSDEPIAFGLDVVNSTTNPCMREDLISFDWNKGAKVDRGDAKWFDMNLDDVKAAGKHVKLTFTNHTDSLVWAATVVSVECPAKLTLPLIVPVPAGMSIDHVINYQLFAVADLHNIYLGVLADGALELKAEGIDATITPSADCLTAKKIVTGEEYVQNAGSQWYQFPMSLIDEMGSAARLSFENKTDNQATITAGVSVGCEYSPITCAKVKVPRNIDFSLNMPRRIIAKLRGLIDPNITDFYLQLTTNQTIAFSLTTQSVDVNACTSATALDWNVWETEGLKLEANKDTWYKVNVDYLLKKFKNGEDISLMVSNPNASAVNVDLAVSPTCPVVLTLEESRSFPARTSAGVSFSSADIVNFLEQYDTHNLLHRDYKELLKQVNAYTLYNKLNQMLVERGYYDNVSAYVPMDRIESIVDRYGEDVSLVNLKKLLEDPKKYISVAEIKAQLLSVKEKVQNKAEEKLTFDNMIAALEKYGDKIPYVDAETIINNADVLLPYVGTANIILDKCKQYITTDNLAKIVDRCKEYVPFEELKQLAVRIEERLKEYLPDLEKAIYVNVKTDGDLYIGPDSIIVQPGCEDAILIDWTNIKLSELETGWYKFDFTQLHADKPESVVVTINNDRGKPTNLGISAFENCTDEKPIARASRDSIAVGLHSSTVSYAKITSYIGELKEIYAYITIDALDTLPIPVPEGCEAAIEYVWGTDLELNKDDNKWYKLGIADLRGKDCKITLTADNKSDELVKADLELYDNCPANLDNQIVSMMQSINPQTIKSETVGSDKLPQDVDTIYLHVATTGAVTVKLVSNCIDYHFDTIPSYDCKDTIWNDTVHVSATLDSVYVHVVSKFEAPAEMTDSILMAINVAPILTQGVVPNVVGTVDSIKAYYASKDTEAIADVVDVYWTDASLNTVVPCGVILHIMNLVVVDECGNEFTTYNMFNVTPKDTTVIDTTICYGEVYNWDGVPYPIGGEYTEVFEAENGCDSVVTLKLTILPEAKEEITDTTIYEGQSFTWIDAVTYTSSVSGVLYPVKYLGTDCDSLISILNLTVLPRTTINQTITAFVCDGTEYEDPFTKEKHIISSLIPSTWTWTTTVEEVATINVYTFNVKPIVAPAEMTDAIMATISGATPVLTPGLVPNVAGTIDAIKAYYVSNDADSIADVDSVYWTDASLTTIVACGATTHTMELVVEAGCDNFISTNLTFEVAQPIATEETAVACESYTWNGNTYNVSGDYTYTTVGANGCDSVVILHLTINQPVTAEETVVACGAYTWNGNTYNTSGDYTYTTTATNGCDSVVTLHLTINHPVTAEVTAVACDSYSWNGQDYTTSGDYTFTTTAANGCDSVVTLHLTINHPVTAEVTAEACDSYSWNGQDYTTSGDYTFTTTAANGCDSVVTLHLTILPDAEIEKETLTICESEFPYEWRGQTLTAVGLYSGAEPYVGTTCDSVIYELTLQTYVMTLPANITMPIAVCGNPVDVTAATADIEAHIAATDLYAPNTVITWYVNNAVMTNDPIKGGVTDVTVKYVITSDCGTIESEEFVVTVEAPTPENDEDMANIRVVSKYGDRIFLLDLNDFKERFDWTPEPELVSWYKVVGEVDLSSEIGTGADADIKVGTGHYYSTLDGSVIESGDYYAFIKLEEVVHPDDCHTTMRSLILSSAIETLSPQLVSNVVSSGDNLRLINLDADENTEVRVYNMMGELIDTYVVDQLSEFVFNAAHTAGYYLVEVRTANAKTTLRYIVK